MSKEVRNNIRAEMARRGITPGEMANKMRISISTYYRRMRNPDELTLGDIQSAADLLKVPIKTLLEG